MKLRSKVWLERDGELVFGPGRARLLEALAERGSISAAAEELDMSYRRAWAMLKASERRLGSRLVERTRGGAGGGGARLTPVGQKVLETFRRLESDFRTLTEEKQHEVDDLRM